MSRIRLILMSLLAVFAVSAVASAAASAAVPTCYKVAVAKTGRFETKKTCENETPVVAEGEWIDTARLTKHLAGTEWCAEVFAKETGTYEDAGCATAKAKGNFIKVTVEPKLIWEVCERGSNAEKAKFSNHKCNSHEGGTEGWEWKKLESGNAWNISSLGGEQLLKGKLGTATIEIKCAEVENAGAIEGGSPGIDKAEVIYHGCEIVGAPTCGVKSPGKISGVISLNVKTTLVEIAAGVEGDKFEPASGTVFVELELGKTENSESHTFEEKCGLLPETAQKVEGATVGLAENGAEGNLCEKLNFTNPAQAGSTLEFGKKEALYVGITEVTMENLWSARCA
jgi:hypothetical protein